MKKLSVIAIALGLFSLALNIFLISKYISMEKTLGNRVQVISDFDKAPGSQLQEPVYQASPVYPLQVKDGYLVFETFYREIYGGFALKIKLSGDIDPDKLRACILEDGSGISLCFLSSNLSFKPLYAYSIISHEAYGRKYPDSLSQIVKDKNGYYLIEELLNLEVLERRNPDDMLAANYSHYLSQEGVVSLEFFE